MKFAYILLYLLFFFFWSRAFAQKIHPDYWDGVLYFQVKKNISRTPPIFNKSKSLPLTEAGAEWVLLIKKYGITAIEKASQLPYPELQAFYKIEFENIGQTYALMKELLALPEIALVEQKPIDRIVNTPNDPSFAGLQWYLHKINAPRAWALSTGSPSIMVAIVDNAVRTTHSDLAPKIVAGWDVADGDADPNPPLSRTTNTRFSHGTHCAGIAAAATNNGIGMASIGYNISILPVKCTRDNATDPDVISHGYEGIEYAINRGAHVISLSWGSYRYSSFGQTLINRAVSNGIVVVGAAGNDNTSSKMYPGAFDNVICVGATDAQDKIASFSNYGSHIDVMAPGSNIYSATATSNSSFATYNGTSMATPLVAGLAGLILSYKPGTTPMGVKQCIKNSAININSINPGFSGQIGAGRIDAEAALLCQPPKLECGFDAFEPNNFRTDAKSLTGTVQGYICPAGDIDWFRFTLSAPASFTVTLSNLPADYDIQLYNANNQLLRESDNWSTMNERIIMTNVSPGTYFLRISGYDGAFSMLSPYTLSLVIEGGASESCPTPFINQTSNLTATTAQINWSGVSQAVSYTVQFKPQTSLSWQTITTSTNFFQFNALEPGTTYEFQVRSNCLNGAQSPFSNIGIFSTLGAACSTPQGLIVTNVTRSSASFTWLASNGATSYNLRYAVVGTSNWVTVTANTNATTINNLIPSTNYQAQVQAICEASKTNSNFSPIVSFTTEGEVSLCSPPSKIWVSNILANSALVSWEPVAGVNFYSIEYREFGSNWQKLMTAQTSITLSALNAATLYEYRLQSFCANNATSPYSITQSFTTLSGQSCATPSGLAASSVTGVSAVITWSESLAALNYEILYREQGTNNWLTATSSTNRVILTGLTPSTTYDVFVRAVCVNLASGYSTLFNFTSASVSLSCQAPSLLGVSSITASSATISWSSAPSVTEYLVKYKALGSNSWNNISLSSTSITLNNLQPQTVYEYQIDVICNSGQRASSVVANFTTLAAPILECVTPQNLRVVSVTNNSALINWNAVSAALSYNIAYRTQGLNNWLTINVPSNSVQITGLAGGLVYEVYVQAVCSGGNLSSYTPPFTFNTPALRSLQTLEDKFSLTLFPNPARRELTIFTENENLNSAKIQICDILGKIIVEEVLPSSYNNNAYTISIEDLPAGFYNMVLEKEAKRYVKKLQKVD
jgi:subtilisin family serine protease